MINTGLEVKLEGLEGRDSITVYKIKNDYYGNPRYVFHFLDLGLKGYVSLSEYGLKKYRGKDFGGGYVIQSFNIKEDLNHIIKKLKKDKVI